MSEIIPGKLLTHMKEQNVRHLIFNYLADLLINNDLLKCSASDVCPEEKSKL